MLPGMRFSQRSCCRWGYSGIWLCVSGQVLPDVSKDRSSIFVDCSILKMKAERFFGTIETCALNDTASHPRRVGSSQEVLCLPSRTCWHTQRVHGQRLWQDSCVDPNVQRKLSRYAYGSKPLGVVCNVLHGYSCLSLCVNDSETNAGINPLIVTVFWIIFIVWRSCVRASLV